MQSYRLRIALRDLPGALADVTQALAEGGCNVLRVDVQAVDGQVAVDELSVQVPDATTADGLRAWLRGAGAEPLLVDPLPAETDLDPVTAAIDDVREVALAPREDRPRRLDGALRRQLGADGGWVLPRPHAGMPLFGRDTVDAPTVVTVSTRGGTARDRSATLALVPSDGVLGVALRWGRWTFTASELARAGALLRTAPLLPLDDREVPPSPASVVVTDTARGPVAVRPLGPADAIHLLELDLRLGDRSRRLRFNGSRGLPSGEELRAVTARRADRRSFGAWTAGGLVGEATYIRLDDEPGTAELAVAVADLAQRQGVGTLLLRRLVTAAADDGLRRLVASSVPANDGLRRLLTAVSSVAITRIAHGSVEHQLDLADVRRG